MPKIFISGFLLNMDEVEIVKLFLPFGNVDTIKIVRDKKTGKPKGYAFVEMPNDDQAYQAVFSLNGMLVGGRQITANIVEEKIETAIAQIVINLPTNTNPKYVKILPSTSPFKKKRRRRSSID